MGISSRFVARILGTDDDEGSGCKCLVFLGATCGEGEVRSVERWWRRSRWCRLGRGCVVDLVVRVRL